VKGKKRQARFERRVKAWDAIDYPKGFARPGSYKKPHPKGR